MSEQRETFVFDTSKIVAAIQKTYKDEHSDEYLELPDELYIILNYLPELFQDDSEEKYIDALSLAMQTSYENGLYQFAYVQYHMLFMTAIYFVLLKVSILHEEEMNKALFYLLRDRYKDFYGDENTKDRKLYFGSFAAINESEVFILLRIIGMDSDLGGELKKFVQERNRYAHANGQLQLTSEDYFLEKIRNFNNKIEKVFVLLKNDILSLYQNLLCDPSFYDSETRAYIEAGQQIQEEFVRKYGFSRIELNWCRKFDIKQLELQEGYAYIKELHIALCDYYKDILSEDE